MLYLQHSISISLHFFIAILLKILVFLIKKLILEF